MPSVMIWHSEKALFAVFECNKNSQRDEQVDHIECLTLYYDQLAE
jgi:hypothetical protein